MRRIASFLLALLLCLTLTPVLTAEAAVPVDEAAAVAETALPDAAEQADDGVQRIPAPTQPAEPHAGDGTLPTPENPAQCGEDVYWYVIPGADGTAETGMVGLKGTGPMWDYTADTAPMAGLKVTKVSVGDKVTRVGDYAFYNTTFTEISFDSALSLTSVGDWAFYGGRPNRFPTLPASLRTVGRNAFCAWRCVGNLELPPCLEYIGDFGFSGALSPYNGGPKIIFTGPVKYIGANAFNFLCNVREIRFIGHAPDYIASNAFSEIAPTSGNYETESTCYAYYPAGDTTWNSVTSGMYGAGRLSWATYSPSYNYCGDDVTWYTNEYSSVLRLGGTGSTWDFTSAAPSYKETCKHATILYIDEGVSAIGVAAFKDVFLWGVNCLEMPSTVTSIGAEAFMNSGSSSGVRKIIFKGHAPAIGADAFSGITSTMIYAGDDLSFTDAIMLNYGGTITWVGYPVLKNQDTTVYAEAGKKASISVTVKGNPLNYQWQYRKNDASAWIDATGTGCNKATYTPTVSLSQDGYQFRCRVWNDGGSLWSEPCTLSVVEPVVIPLAITSQPKSVTVTEGNTVQFAIEVTGDDPVYRWQYRTGSTDTWKNSGAAGHATPTLSIEATIARNGYQYRCVVENAAGKVISKAATLTVTAETKPTITKQPISATTYVSDSTTFLVNADGGNLTYRWQYKTPDGTWKNSGATGHDTNRLTIVGATSRNGYQYRCVVENSKGKVISTAVTLTVKPKITTQPSDRMATVDATVQFTIAAKGDGLTYRWQYYTGSAWKNSSFTGHDTPTLSVTVSGARDKQKYRCVVTDVNGTKTISRVVQLFAKAKIRSEPTNVVMPKSGTYIVTFKVKVEGVGLTYRWQYLGSDGTWHTQNQLTGTIWGTDSATLTLGVDKEFAGYTFRCVITDEYGTELISKSATLTASSGGINVPRITSQPKDVYTLEGETEQFTVKATGPDLTYQWYYKESGAETWKKCTGAGYNTNTLTVEAKSYRFGYLYRCTVTNEHGYEISYSVGLYQCTQPIVRTEPDDETAAVGKTVIFWVSASGGGLSYQWYYRTSSTDTWKTCTGDSATTRFLHVDAKAYRNGYQYRCLVSNKAGSVYTRAATLTVTS